MTECGRIDELGRIPVNRAPILSRMIRVLQPGNGKYTTHQERPEHL